MDDSDDEILSSDGTPPSKRQRRQLGAEIQESSHLCSDTNSCCTICTSTLHVQLVRFPSDLSIGGLAYDSWPFRILYARFSSRISRYCHDASRRRSRRTSHRNAEGDEQTHGISMLCNASMDMNADLMYPSRSSVES